MKEVINNYSRNRLTDEKIKELSEKYGIPENSIKSIAEKIDKLANDIFNKIHNKINKDSVANFNAMQQAMKNFVNTELNKVNNACNFIDKIASSQTFGIAKDVLPNIINKELIDHGKVVTEITPEVVKKILEKMEFEKGVGRGRPHYDPTVIDFIDEIIMTPTARSWFKSALRELKTIAGYLKGFSYEGSAIDFERTAEELKQFGGKWVIPVYERKIYKPRVREHIWWIVDISGSMSGYFPIFKGIFLALKDFGLKQKIVVFSDGAAIWNVEKERALDILNKVTAEAGIGGGTQPEKAFEVIISNTLVDERIKKRLANTVRTHYKKCPEEYHQQRTIINS
jgi:hypothetical protein